MSQVKRAIREYLLEVIDYLIRQCFSKIKHYICEVTKSRSRHVINN